MNVTQMQHFYAKEGVQRLNWCLFVHVGVDKYTPTRENTVNLITLLANGSDTRKQRQRKPQGTLESSKKKRRNNDWNLRDACLQRKHSAN